MTSSSATVTRIDAPHGMSAQEWQARLDLAAAHRFTALKGWQDDHMIYNHLSMRVPDQPDHFLMKEHDMLFREVTATNLRKLPIDGPPLSYRDNVNPAGYAIHGGILQARPDINSIMHLHSVAGAAMSTIAGGMMFITQESMQFYNRIGYHDFEGVAEIEERETIVRDLGAFNTLILRNHGLLTCGRSVGEAVKRLYHVIRLSEIQLKVMATGAEVVQPPHDVCERTAQLFTNRPFTQTDADWQALVRWVNFHATDYAR
jgi:ribulose-5-phosphate 4-epimerase/fuculose-1-phosphate aldolase